MINSDKENPFLNRSLRLNISPLGQKKAVFGEAGGSTNSISSPELNPFQHPELRLSQQELESILKK